MNTDEKKQLSAELCKRWRGKMTAEDLAYWARELDGFGIHEIIEALTKFRNTSRFVPKVYEIVKLLPRRISETTTAENGDSFADILRGQNRQYEGKSDVEVYLRYYRALWVTYGNGNRNLDAMRSQVTRGCVTSLVTAGLTESKARQSATFIFESPDMFRLALSDLREAKPVESEHVFT